MTVVGLPRILIAVSSYRWWRERMASELVNPWVAKGWPTAPFTLSGSDWDHYAVDDRVERIGLDLMSDSPFSIVGHNVEPAPKPQDPPRCQGIRA